MSESSLNNCGKCQIGQGSDCASCKLASLGKKKNQMDVEEDDYSISERLTENKGDNTILYLVLIVLLIFAVTILFTKLLQ